MASAPLGLAMLTTALILAAPIGATAQSFVCWPIAPGESAPHLALRLTGNASASYSERFQIRDPARRVVVPKSQYGHLRASWQVCVAREMVRPPSSRAPSAPLHAPVVAATRLAIPGPPPLTRYDVVMAMRVGVATTVVLFVCTLSARVAQAHMTPRELQDAGDEFIGAFVRPLIEPGCSVLPIEVRLRFRARSRQLEIRLAPSGGRRYPNLRDHKRNVEYDVERVVRLLAPHIVLSSPVRAEGKWVVVPIRINEQKQAGAL